jgi:large subunit ribosomal protein L15e
METTQTQEKPKFARGLYHFLRESWKKPDTAKIRELMIKWRSEPTILVIEKPTRLDRARTLGYKAKKGIVVVRVRVPRGGRKRHRTNKGRKTRRHTIKKVVKMNYKWIAEQRVQRAYPNLEVLNSYNLAKDGIYYFFEVILIDPDKLEIKNDKNFKWASESSNHARVFRGLTLSGRKSRGMLNKSPTNKNRPSVRAGLRRGK